MVYEINIRPARVCDAHDCSIVLCASIRRLCILDHGGNQWVGNKTPENLAKWIQNPNSNFLVAEVASKIAAVGSFNESQEVELNYVSPDYRFCGVSKALLARMEFMIAESGAQTAKLTSTETAHRFYLSAGWRDVADPVMWCGMAGYPMEKTL